MDNGDGYADSKNAASPYSNKNSQSPASSPAPPSLPEVNFRFFVLSSVTRNDRLEFIRTLFSTVPYVWNPLDPEFQKIEINLKWDDVIKEIADRDGTFKKIEFDDNSGAPKAVRLVKENYSNPTFKPEIPVFVVEGAWNESQNPKEGLEGYTLVRTQPGFSGEPAIFLFSTKADKWALAHELAHWIGGGNVYTHPHVASDNIGYRPPGDQVTRAQLVALKRWASDVGRRKELATKL
jgi:hypothetical protein